MLILIYYFTSSYISILYARFSSQKTLACLIMIICLQKSVKHLHCEGFPNPSRLYCLCRYHYIEHMLLYLSVCLSSQLSCKLLECRDGYLIFLYVSCMQHSTGPIKSYRTLMISYSITVLFFFFFFIKKEPEIQKLTCLGSSSLSQWQNSELGSLGLRYLC